MSKRAVIRDPTVIENKEDNFDKDSVPAKNLKLVGMNTNVE